MNKKEKIYVAALFGVFVVAMFVMDLLSTLPPLVNVSGCCILLILVGPAILMLEDWIFNTKEEP
jgi:uncharacterized membrane-anchored protein